MRDPRRRLLRPRRRAALQHARRDPRAGGLRRHARVADRRAGGGAVRRGRAAVRAARLRDRLRQRRQDEATPVQTLLDMMAASTATFASVLAAAVPRAAAADLAPAGTVYRFERLTADDAHATSAARPAISRSSSLNARFVAAAHAQLDAVPAAEGADARRSGRSGCAGPFSLPPSPSTSRPNRIARMSVLRRVLLEAARAAACARPGLRPPGIADAVALA